MSKYVVAWFCIFWTSLQITLAFHLDWAQAVAIGLPVGLFGYAILSKVWDL